MDETLEKDLEFRVDSLGKKVFNCRCDYGIPCPSDVLKYKKVRIPQKGNTADNLLR